MCMVCVCGVVYMCCVYVVCMFCMCAVYVCSVYCGACVWCVYVCVCVLCVWCVCVCVCHKYSLVHFGFTDVISLVFFSLALLNPDISRTPSVSEVTHSQQVLLKKILRRMRHDLA